MGRRLRVSKGPVKGAEAIKYEIMSKPHRPTSYENASGKRGEPETPMHGEAWVGAHKRLRRLIRQGHDVDALDDTGESPLHGAASHGNATALRVLLRAGADPNMHATDTGMTPLHWACGWGGLAAVRALVRHGADVDAKDHKDRTPEQVALEHGKAGVAEWLRQRRLQAASER